MQRAFGAGAALSLATLVGLVIESGWVPHPVAIPVLSIVLVGCLIGWLLAWQLKKALSPVESQANSGGDRSAGLNANHNGKGDIMQTVNQTTNYGYRPKEDSQGSHRGEPLSKITAERLVGFYTDTGLTSMQADRSVAPFLGKLRRESGTVHNVALYDGGERAVVTLRDEGRPEILLEFGREWIARLEELGRDDRIVAIGRLESVNATGIRVRDCEIDDKPVPPAPLGEHGVGSP